MPPRLNLCTAQKAISAFRQPSVASPRSIATHARFRAAQSAAPLQKRWNSSRNAANDLPERPKGPSEDPLPSVSEEDAEIDRIMNKEKRCDGQPASPELEQGTPVSEILSRDKEALKHMPKVIQDQVKKNGGSRSFSTSARSRLPDVQEINTAREDPSIAMVASMIERVTEQAQGQVAESHSGLKFDPPVSPANTKTLNFRKRYDTLQEQFTKMIMEDGKLSRAQKVMASILDQLRTSPAPQVNARRRLLGAPPAPQLPLDPVLYLTLIVDSVAPLFRIRQQKGLTGGGTAVQIPHPLTLRQRRRSAIKWIIDASDKRRDTHLAQRIANELLAVAEGRSGVWERRDQQHKLGIAGRANLGLAPRRR